jgi:hypothetical protein
VAAPEASSLASVEPRSFAGVDLLEVHRVALPADVPPWTDTGIELQTGQWITLLASGRVTWSHRGRDFWAGPKHHLWGRVGPEGQVFNPTRDTTSVAVEGSGRLFLGLLHGFWANERGALATSPESYVGLGGGIEVVAMVWSGPPGAGLRVLAEEHAGSLLAAEAARIASPTPVPKGWSYLFETGHADIYLAEQGGAQIAIASDNDQGIIRKPIAFPLDADTTLSWRWRLDELPSREPEDRVASHDYMSIACEFENGRDLTWFWSAALPEGRFFGCPVRAWNYREVHLCVRSGARGLGTWCREERSVLADCQRALGHHPGAIRSVWLICVSSFQHGVARGAFADIVLSSRGRSERVL